MVKPVDVDANFAVSLLMGFDQDLQIAGGGSGITVRDKRTINCFKNWC